MPIGEELKPRIREKRWDKSLEPKLYEKWVEEGIQKFNYDPGDKRPVLVIDTPPPYASGKWHVGGAAHYAQIDMVARYFRMRGYNVLIPFYADRNGLPVEVYVEKKYNINPHEAAKTREGREKFLLLCRRRLDEAEDEIVRVWRRMGCLYEYWRNGTDSPEYRRITQATFIELWRRGLIYEAERPVNWCPRCKTTLADAELEYREEKGTLYYIKFKVEDTGEEAVIATTRPELLNSCAAAIYNPSDERYKHLRGKRLIVPIYENRIPVVEHPAAKPEFGTGLVMICSYGDTRDVQLFRELGLKPRILIDRDGRMTGEAGPIAGLPVREARRRIAQLLEEKGYLVKKEPLVHQVPVCWRCKTPIEILHEKEFFLKQLDFKEDMLRIAGSIPFYPEEHRQRLIDWIKSVSTDWPISRSRYYATEIPVWRCRRCGSILVPEPGKYYRPWRDEPPFNKCPVCGAPRSELEGEKKVFDTWFDSSISPLYTSFYMRDERLHEKLFGNIMRPQGEDIIRTWLYYTLLRVYQLKGKPAFKWIRVTGMGLDEKGEAMHKSKGNVIDPEPVIDKYGADAFRYWAAASGKLGSDYRFQEQLVKTGALFATKIWNIARFISAFPKPTDYRLRPLDEMMLAYYNKAVERILKAYDELDVYRPAVELYSLTWNVFASHYIEAAKPRAYNREHVFREDEQRGAWFTLHEVLSGILRLLAPIMPFVTDAVWRRLYGGGSIHVQLMPEPRREYESPYAQLMEKFMDANRRIWNYKKSLGLTLGKPLNGILILPRSLEPIARDLSVMHRAAGFTIGEPTGGDIDLGGGIGVRPPRGS